MSHLTVLTEEDVLTQLRIISFLQPLDRLSTNSPVVRVQKPTLLRSLSRMVNSDSRHSTLLYVRTLFHKAGEFYKNSGGNESTRARFRREAISAIRGMRNLQTTYEDDPAFISATEISIETLILTMDLTELQADDAAAADDTKQPPNPRSSPPPASIRQIRNPRGAATGRRHISRTARIATADDTGAASAPPPSDQQPAIACENNDSTFAPSSSDDDRGEFT